MLPYSAHAAEVSPTTPAGWLPHFESWVTLAIILSAFLIAWLLNHAQPKARALGASLSALSCFGIVAWFAAALGTGVIENPKDFQVPMDAWKPTLLWGQIIVAFCAGISLLIVASRQYKSTEVLDISGKNEEAR